MWMYIVDLLLALVALGMIFGGKYGVTRQLGFAPLAVAVLDAAFVSQIDWSLTPAVSVALLAVQLVILSGSTILLYEDRVHARNKQTRRRRRRELARSAAAFEDASRRRERIAQGVCA